MRLLALAFFVAAVITIVITVALLRKAQEQLRLREDRNAKRSWHVASRTGDGVTSVWLENRKTSRRVALGYVVLEQRVFGIVDNFDPDYEGRLFNMAEDAKVRAEFLNRIGTEIK
jgi:hypothetical protein